jgi:hypothetical protein
VPLVAAGVDQLRVAAFCPGETQSCLEAAGGGLLGPLGLVVLVLYAAGLALVVGRLSRRPPTLARLWMTASGGLLAVCGGHAGLAAALGEGTATGTGWLQLLPLILAAGALLALALRAAPAAVRLLRRLRPRAPRTRVAAAAVSHDRPPTVTAFSRVAALTAAGRAPPHRLVQP